MTFLFIFLRLESTVAFLRQFMNYSFIKFEILIFPIGVILLKVN